MNTWNVSFKGEYPMWRVEARSAEEAIKDIAKLNNLNPDDLEAK